MKEFFSTEFWKLAVERASEWLITTLPSLLLVVVLAFVVLKVVGFLLKRVRALMLTRAEKEARSGTSETQKRIETLLGILGTTIRNVVWLMIGMVLLRELGVDIAPLIAGAGIAGLAIGFGAQELVRDFLSGFFVLLENQIRLGDVAIINGTGGVVEHIGLRTTTLRDLSGVVHVFQNGKINTLSNMTKEWSAMVFDIGVAYKEDTDRVVEVMRAVAEELRGDEPYRDNILEPLEVMGVDKFDDSAVIVKARLKTRPIQQWSVGREYRRRLKKAFDREGIEIPFPHRTVYWGEEINPLKVQSSAAAQQN